MTIRIAGADEAGGIAALVNGAYRGAGARTGWTHEADLLDGQRADAAMIAALIEAVRGAILVLRLTPDAAPAGCVAVAPTATPHVWSLGMLTVEPGLQAGGLGRRLIEAGEAYAAGHAARTLRMTVIATRASLIAYYERRGYRLTGETAPFPYGDDRIGLPKRDDLDFVVMEKRVDQTLSSATTPVGGSVAFR